MEDDFFRAILVVDDDGAVRKTISGFLQKAGYDCEVAPDAAGARAWLEVKAFNLVVSDVVMKEQDGISLMKEVRRLAPAIEFILITGHGDRYSHGEIIAAGAADYLTKPFALSDLEARIERIRGRNGRRESSGSIRTSWRNW